MGDKGKTIIHIGYPKTGSTWLQKSFFPKIKNIAFINHRSIPENFFSAGLTKNELTDIRQFFQNNDTKVLLSDEGLIGTHNTIVRNAKRLREIFGEAEIIIFIRNQIDKYASNYSQYVKEGITCSVDDFIFPYGYSKEPYGGYKHLYDKLFDIYKEIFGSEHVHGFLFEDFIQSPELFIRNFAKKFEFEIDLKKINYIPRNQRLSLAGIKIKRFLNYFTRKCAYSLKNKEYLKKYYVHIPLWYELSFYITRQMQNLGFFCRKGTYDKILSKNTINKLEVFFKASNKKLIENHGFKAITKYNYPL